MTLQEWSKSEIDYGRKLLHSGIEGARDGRDAFLNGKPLDPFLHDSLQHAWIPTAVGLCVGILASNPRHRHTSLPKMMGCAILGGAIGFTATMVWETRRLTRSAACSALDHLNKTRDEHWFEKHPIDYA